MSCNECNVSPDDRVMVRMPLDRQRKHWWLCVPCYCARFADDVMAAAKGGRR